MSLVNPFSPEHADNPYPAFAELRACAPLLYHQELGFWIATSAEAVRTVLATPDDFMSAKGIGPVRNEVIHRPTMLTRDPPDHTRLRSLVNQAFTPRRIAGLEGRLCQIVSELLDAGLAQGRFDLVKDFADPLPGAVISALLSIEPERRADMERWSGDIVKSVAGFGNQHNRERTRQSYREFDAYFENKIEQRRRHRHNDLLGELVVAQEEHGALSSVEITSFCMLLFIAGTETTTNLITNATMALLAHPEQERNFRAEPSLIASLIEETLRYDPPVQGMFRTTRREVERFGVRIGPDQKVLALIAAGNRDPSVFPDPDRFDLLRTPNPHTAFGQGIHYCLGASLARLEARLALGALFRRTSAIRRDAAGEAQRLSTQIVRGMVRYPVILSPA